MKKNILTILVLALLIVNIGLTAVLMFSVMGNNAKSAQLISNISTALSLELTNPGQGMIVAEPELAMSDLTLWTLNGAMTIPVSGESSGSHYVQFEIAFSLNTKTEGYKQYGETISNYEMLVKDAIVTTVSSRTLEECKSDFEGVRNSILNAVRNLFGNDGDFIYKVAINEVKFQ